MPIAKFTTDLTFRPTELLGQFQGSFQVRKEWAPRSHIASIEIAVGEERFYRLPPMSPGAVQVKAYHAEIDVSGARRVTPAPQPQPEIGIASRVAALTRIDTTDSLGGVLDTGVHADTSPARNLQLELTHGGASMGSHGNFIMAESLWFDDHWRLRIKRPPMLNDLTPNPGRYGIEVHYISQLPILERRIPASFFHDGFEFNWNQQRYVYGHVSGSKVFISFRTDLKQLHGLEDVVIDTGIPLAEARDIHTTSVQLDVGAGPSPQGGGNVPFFSVRVDCAAGGMIELPLLPDVKLPAFYVIVRLYLCRRGDGLQYVPVVESNLLDALADVDIRDFPDVWNTTNAKAWAKKKIEDGILALQFPPQSGISNFGKVLAPWLIGDQRELWALSYSPAATDMRRGDGVIESAGGEIFLSYVGPRDKPNREPVLASDVDGGPAIPINDGSVPLFDLPEEVPDPESTSNGEDNAPVGGGGHVPAPRIGALAKIDHIVVLMMENRSFDQVLGYLSREMGRANVNGLNNLPRDPQVNKQFNRHNNRNYFPQRALSTAWPSFLTPGPGHETEDVQTQIDEQMGRFVTNFAGRVGDDPNLLRLIMDYFGADQLPVYAALAREFGICDAWFTAHAGPTWPNRFVMITGDLNLDRIGNVEDNNPDVKTMLPIKIATIFDHLSDRGVSWRVFENGFSFPRLFRNFTFDTTNIVSFDDAVRGFEATARSGALPSVSLIEPDYIDLPPGNDDHPPANMVDGQAFVNRVVQAVMAGPQWEKTMLVITYDEHGGFYDHVVPPTDAPPLRGNRVIMGPRVPTFVVSPLVKRGDVIHSRFDHTSIGATILRRFAGQRPLPNISARLDAARDLREVLTLDQPRSRAEFANIGLPALAARALTRSARRSGRSTIGTPQGNDDFHWVLSAIRLMTGEGPR